MNILQKTDTHSAVKAFLIFHLDSSAYAIPVESVREIITSVSMSPIPGAPDYLSGVINLRGRILPVVDLRKRFRFSSTVSRERDCFIILMLETMGKHIEVGIRVDSVTEVAWIDEDGIDTAPTVSNFSDKLVFQGVAKTSSGIKLILDSPTLIKQLQQDIALQCMSTVDPANVIS